MAGSQTFTIVKPTALRNGCLGKIICMIQDQGFKIKALKIVQMTKGMAEKFYEVHKDRPFYHDLVQFMISGPVAVAVLEKENAVAAFRQIIGSTDPGKAAPETIRYKCGTSIQANAVHGSDSDENALAEAGFFFSGSEMVGE